MTEQDNHSEKALTWQGSSVRELEGCAESLLTIFEVSETNGLFVLLLSDGEDVRMNDGEDVGINDGIIVGIIEGMWLMKVMSCGINRKPTNNGKEG